MKVTLPGVKGPVDCEVKRNEKKRMAMPAMVALKSDCQLEADVYFQVHGKWKVRTARLGDNVFFLYKRAKITKILRGGHSSLSLALPLRNVIVNHSHSNLYPSSLVLSTLYSQASALSPSLQETFSLNELKEAIQSFFPRAQVTQLIQDFISAGILYKLPHNPSVAVTYQQEPHYAFRSHPISQDCCVSLIVAGTKLDYYFANADIADVWAKKLRFEADTAPAFPPQNWLGTNPRCSEIRDIDVFLESHKVGPIPVLTICPYDFSVTHFNTPSFLQASRSVIDLQIAGMGVSLIDSVPEECSYLFIDGIELLATLSSNIQDIQFTIQNIQIDVSSYDAAFPCLLYTLRRDLVKSTATHSYSEPETTRSAQSPVSSPRSQRSTRISASQRHQILTNLTKQEKETRQLVESVEKKEKLALNTCSACGTVFKGDKRPLLHACGQRQANQQNCMQINRGMVVLEKMVMKVDELFLLKLKRQFVLLSVRLFFSSLCIGLVVSIFIQLLILSNAIRVHSNRYLQFISS